MKKVLASFLILPIVLSVILSVSVSNVMALPYEETFSSTLYCGKSKVLDKQVIKDWDPWSGCKSTYSVSLTSTSAKCTGISFAIPNNLYGIHLVFRPYESYDTSTKICSSVDFYRAIFTYRWTMNGTYYESFMSKDHSYNPVFALKSSLSGSVEYITYSGKWNA